MDARRIALIKPSALGDIVHSLPVLTALRVRFPAARITWVVNSAYEPLIRNHPDLTDTLAFDRGMFKKRRVAGHRYAVSFGRELRRRQFDLVIDLQGLFRTGLMCLATRAPRRIGFANAREGSRYAYTHKDSRARTRTAFTRSTATGAWPKRSGPAMCRSGSTSRSTRPR